MKLILTVFAAFVVRCDVLTCTVKEEQSTVGLLNY
jgi:hypothetical protein